MICGAWAGRSTHRISDVSRIEPTLTGLTDCLLNEIADEAAGSILMSQGGVVGG